MSTNSIELTSQAMSRRPSTFRNNKTISTEALFLLHSGQSLVRARYCSVSAHNCHVTSSCGILRPVNSKEIDSQEFQAGILRRLENIEYQSFCVYERAGTRID